jgi:hypothetical protein
VEAELPSLSKTLLLLGESSQQETKGGLRTFSYRYRIVTETRPIPILAQLGFAEDGLLSRVYVKWDQSAIEAIFVRAERRSPASDAP